MFTDPFSIRALLQLPIEPQSRPGATCTTDTSHLTETSATSHQAAPIPAVIQHAVHPQLVNLYLQRRQAAASAFRRSETPHPAGQVVAQGAAESRRPAQENAAPRLGQWFWRRPTLVARMLACLHVAPAGRRYTFTELRLMLPKGAKSHAAIDTMLQHGVLNRIGRGLYERTGLQMTLLRPERGTGGFPRFQLPIVRSN